MAGERFANIRNSIMARPPDKTSQVRKLLRVTPSVLGVIIRVIIKAIVGLANIKETVISCSKAVTL